MPTSESAHSALAQPEILGSVLGGRYRVVSLIGNGGMAKVFRAFDEALTRDVAIKLIPLADSNPEAVRRQRNETDVLASLNHHALVTLFDVGTTATREGEHAYLVMEYVDGPTLRSMIDEPMPAREVAEIGENIAEALHYTHGRGIVHRDIKPANILLADSAMPDRRYHAKLADFGIARLMGSAHLTSTGFIVGTASYLSPEQARGERVGGAADVYALGLVLLEALTGQQAYPGSSIETVVARLSSPPRIPGMLGRRWGELLQRMTAPEPASRPEPLEAAMALRELAGLPADAVGAGAALDPTVALGTGRLGTGRLSGEALRAEPEAPGTESSVAVVDPTPAARTSELSRHPHPPRPIRRRAILAVAGAAVVLAATGGAIAWTSAPSEPAATVSPYPHVSGTLGTHLEQLQEGVSP